MQTRERLPVLTATTGRYRLLLARKQVTPPAKLANISADNKSRGSCVQGRVDKSGTAPGPAGSYRFDDARQGQQLQRFCGVILAGGRRGLPGITETDPLWSISMLATPPVRGQS